MPEESFLSIFIFSFLIAIGAVMSPGPVSTAIVSQAPRTGWRIGPLITIGHSLLEMLMVIALATGLQKFLAQPGIEIGVALVGGTLLIWMGISILLSLRGSENRLASNNSGKTSKSGLDLVWLGVLATISNPFWFAWWISVPTSYLSESGQLGSVALMAFYFGHISADLAWNSFLAAAIASGKRWISDKTYGLILGASSLFFIYLGGSFLIRGYSLF
jgi:threonine/homoserine/homoserine lactone efflux protein